MVAFLTPTLRRLEDGPAQLAVFFCFDELRPFQGILSLVDWRLHGRLSKRMIEGFFKGDANSPLLVLPGRLLPIPFVLLIGLGARERFERNIFESAVSRVFEIGQDLKIRRTAVALPGRSEECVTPENAMEWFIHVYDRYWQTIDEIFLIESPKAQKAMTPVLERWRLRRLIPGLATD